MKVILSILSTCLIIASSASAKQKIIHVFIALCDNDTQGIVPVNPTIGNGDKPEANLYWGCSDGIQKYFAKSKRWKKLETHKPQLTNTSSPILRRIIFQHKKTNSILVADAYQGKSIQQCITNYLNASTGSYKAIIKVKSTKQTIQIGAKANLTAYIGHNGLMEFNISTTKTKNTPHLDTITLCCIAHKYFKHHFNNTNTTPILQTRSLMYPGSFILHDALEGWFNKESKSKIRTRAAKAYAKNQKISTKAAYSIFKNLNQK